MALATFAVICLTDYFDGWLARNWNCTTKAGAVLDAISDLWYVLAVSTTLKIMGLLPDLYILIIMLKFGEFTVTSRFLRQRVKGTGTFVYDRLGRATAVLFFAIPGVAILSRILGGNTMVSVKSLVFATGCMAVLSSIGRIEACFGTNRINGGNPLWIRNS